MQKVGEHMVESHTGDKTCCTLVIPVVNYEEGPGGLIIFILIVTPSL